MHRKNPDDVANDMNRILRAAICIFTLFAVFPTQAGVMSVRAEKPDWFKTLNGNTSWNIFLDGEIDPGAAARVAEALRRTGSDGADVYINSPGGNLLIGMQIGRLIRKAGASTWIGRLVTDPSSGLPGRPGVKRLSGQCHSACSLAFLGGVYRYADKDDVYGVHRFSSNASPTSVDLDTAQVVSAAIGAYIREMDVDPALFDLMVEQGKDGIRILTAGELTHLNVVNNGRQKAEWTIESVEGGQYLRGMQDTVYGRGKAVFLCRKGQIGFLSFYQSGVEQAKSIASGGWYHSLLLNGKVVALTDPVNARATGDEIATEFALDRDQALAVSSSSTVGHAMQVGRDAPTFVGYQIDIPPASSRKVSTFLRNCYVSAR